MTGLNPATRYSYTLDGSGNYTFTNQPAGVKRTYAVYGDFGDANDVSITQLKAEAATGGFDMVLHVGDMAYDLSTTGGTVGNAFMNDIEPVAASVPYVAVVGNHERAASFGHFIARWGGMQQLANNSNSRSPLWFSFDDGLAHIVGIDTEVYAYGTAAEATEQLAWLAADLAAVNRSVTPWVVVIGHKQGWMDSISGHGGSFLDLEKVLQDGGADLYFGGHQHNYDRLLPLNDGKVEDGCVSADNATYTDCTYMITVIAGSPGCRELVSKGHSPVGVVVFSETYGYGHLTIESAETAQWQWEQLKVPAPDGSGKLVAAPNAFFDSFTIIKHRN